MASNISDRVNGFNSSTGIKTPVIAATTANITLSAVQTIDGIAVVADNRVLVKDQTDTTENGIYDVNSGDWSRAPDFDGNRDVVTGTTVFVASGTANGGEYWYVSTAGDPEPGEAMALTQAPLGGAATTAAGVSYDNSTSGLTAADAQDALDELAENRLLPKGTNVASATTTDIGAANSSFVSITGTTTITSFGSTTTRDHVWLQFNSSLTLTHNASSLILPGSANITTAAGDSCLAIRDSGSNWKVVVYQKIDGTAFSIDIVNDVTPQLGGTLDTNSKQVRYSKGSDVASANALTLGTDGNIFDVTGTTAITSIGTLAVGTTVKLHFDGILTLTHHATDLILPSGANITTAAGDEAEFYEYAAGDWRCTSYTTASGEALVSTGITLATKQATTSGTAFDFTGIPSGTKIITVQFKGVSTSGTDDILIQLGDAGGIETSGYVSLASTLDGTPTESASTAGFNIAGGTAALVVSGTYVLHLHDASTFEWVGNHTVKGNNSSRTGNGGGDKSLSAELTQLRITTVSGTDTFDAGSVNISYQ